jgi:hypothetical protein
VLENFELAMLAAAQAAGRPVGVGCLRASLKQHGHHAVANRLSALAKQRRWAAHPDVSFLADIGAAIEDIPAEGWRFKAAANSGGPAGEAEDAELELEDPDLEDGQLATKVQLVELGRRLSEIEKALCARVVPVAVEESGDVQVLGGCSLCNHGGQLAAGLRCSSNEETLMLKLELLEYKIEGLIAAAEAPEEEEATAEEAVADAPAEAVAEEATDEAQFEDAAAEAAGGVPAAGAAAEDVAETPAEETAAEEADTEALMEEAAADAATAEGPEDEASAAEAAAEAPTEVAATKEAAAEMPGLAAVPSFPMWGTVQAASGYSDSDEEEYHAEAEDSDTLEEDYHAAYAAMVAAVPVGQRHLLEGCDLNYEPRRMKREPISGSSGAAKW